MLNHVSVGVRDVARATEFYDAVFAALGYKRVLEYLPHAIGYGDKYPTFWVQLPSEGQELTVGNGGHISLIARTKDAIQAFYDAALAKGGTDNGAPGPRPDYSPDYYAAFVIDPDGNKLEATLTPEPVVKPAPKAKKAKRKAKAKAKAAPVKAAPTKPAKKPAKKAAKKAAKKVVKKSAPAPKAKKAKKGKAKKR